MTTLLAWAIVLSILGAMLWVMWMPVIEAYRRRHRNRVAIKYLVIFLGWSVIGWIIAMIWAHTDNVEPIPPA